MGIVERIARLCRLCGKGTREPEEAPVQFAAVDDNVPLA